MLIIIEGVDGSGKSTLAQRLHDLHRGDKPTMLHRGPLQTDPYDEYVAPLVGTLPHVIADRWHVGEMIYGPMFRGASRLTPEMNTWVELFLESRGALRLRIDIDHREIVDRIEERGDDMVNISQIEEIMKKYEMYFTSVDRYLAVTPEQVMTDRIIHTIDKAANDIALAAKPFVEIMPSYVGNRQCNLLVVFEPSARLPGWPSSLESIEWRVVRGLWNAAGVNPELHYGFVSTDDLDAAQRLLAPVRVVYADDLGSTIADVTQKLKEILA